MVCLCLGMGVTKFTREFNHAYLNFVIVVLTAIFDIGVGGGGFSVEQCGVILARFH